MSVKLFGSATVYFGANALNAAIPFLLLPILTRVLSPAEYGTIAMFMVMTNIFSAFTGLSIHGAVGIRYVQLPAEQFSEYVTSCIGLLAISTAVTILMLIAFEPTISGLSGLPIDWLMVSVLVSGFQFLINIRLSIWQAADMPWHYGSLQISRSLLDAALTLILLLGMGMAWQGRVVGNAVAALVMACVAVAWLYKDKFLRKPTVWVRHAVDALRFGLPLIPHTIGGMMLILVDRVVINQLLGTEAVGIYVTAVQIGALVGLFTESFNKAYAPWLFRKLEDPSEGSKRAVVKGAYVYFLLIILFGATYGMLIPFVLPLIVGSEFLTSSELIVYIALGYAFGGCYYIVANFIFYKSRTEYLSLITFIGGLFAIPLTYLLVSQMLLKGAAIAYLVTNIVVFVGVWALASRVHKMPWRLSGGATIAR